MLDVHSLNADSPFLCCSWLGHSHVRLVIVLGGQVRFPQDSGNGLSEQKGSWVHACVSAALSWKHIPDPPGRQRSEGEIRNLFWPWMLWAWSLQRGKAPVIALEEIPISMWAIESMTLPLDPSFQEGEDIESFISLSQAFLFLLHSLCFLLIPPSFPHPMAHEQFLPLLLLKEISFLLKEISGWDWFLCEQTRFWERCHILLPLVHPQEGRDRFPTAAFWCLLMPFCIREM